MFSMYAKIGSAHYGREGPPGTAQRLCGRPWEGGGSLPRCPADALARTGAPLTGASCAGGRESRGPGGSAFSARCPHVGRARVTGGNEHCAPSVLPEGVSL